jgi:hypothetical protein
VSVALDGLKWIVYDPVDLSFRISLAKEQSNRSPEKAGQKKQDRRK